jgi:hypothetical protein
MTRSNPARKVTKPLLVVFALLVLVGVISFFVQLAGKHPEKAWQAYHLNFLLWSAVAQEGCCFPL